MFEPLLSKNEMLVLENNPRGCKILFEYSGETIPSLLKSEQKSLVYD